MKKMLACLLSLTTLSISALNVSAATVVVGVKEDSYFLKNGCVLYQKEINEYAGEELILHYGDVLDIKAESIDPIYPGQFVFGENSKITYLGTVEEYYDNVKELSVTEATPGILILEDDQNEKYKLQYYDVVNFGYEAEIYPSEFSVGDVGLFVLNTENNVIIPLEITYKAEENNALSTGDLNGDGTVSVVDVITINKAILGKELLTSAQDAAADVNRDNQIDSTDSLLMLEYVVGLIDSFDEQ